MTDPSNNAGRRRKVPRGGVPFPSPNDDRLWRDVYPAAKRTIPRMTPSEIRIFRPCKVS